MKPLPLPLRVAAGLAVTAAERARELPKNVVGLPVTVVSQVLQFSMRLQQHVTELAIKGDEVLSALRPVEETPSWATFDEDLPPADEAPARRNGQTPGSVSEASRDPWEQEWEQEERALAEGDFDDDTSATAEGDALEATSPSDLPQTNGTPIDTGSTPLADTEPAEKPAPSTDFGSSGATPATSADDLDESDPESIVGPSGLGNYDELTLPQLRARLRHLTLEQLEELLAYERAHENRPSFVGMLARRIGNVQRQSGNSDAGGTSGPDTSSQ
ncbi:lipid droplet-associated protein [Amycolatopsis sacchari]|uniref:lipid droplet-associated protein n=1 Tax=Amycolatopsis sacchari TaxID=115433 RepID=UPI003D7073AB